MKEEIVTLIGNVLSDMGVSGVVPKIEIPDDAAHGDYTTNVALLLAKDLKRSPMEIAKEIQAGITNYELRITNYQLRQLKADRPLDEITNDESRGKHDQNISQTDQKESSIDGENDVPPLIDRVEAAPPGFINVFLSEATFITNVHQVLEEKEAYGKAKTSVVEARRVTVEFTDPNPFKEFHIGHLYSNSVGESLSRLLESQGQTVRRVNYQGDVGMHVAKAVWGLKQKMTNGELPFGGPLGRRIGELEAMSIGERVKIMGQAYAAGATAYEDPSADGEKAKEEMKDINYLIFIAAQDYLEGTQGWEPQVDYRQYVQGKEENIGDIRELYAKGRAWSLEYFETIYRRLGTAFDGYYFESMVGEYGVKIVRDHIKDGIFEESDGAIVFRGEKVGLHTRVFINSLGLPTYEAKELGLAPAKYRDWPYDESIIVTGKEIDEYFKVLIAAISATNPDLGKKTTHISHGMVRLPEGKMSSRTGKIVTGEGLIDQVKQSVYAIIDQNSSKYAKEDRDTIAEKAAIAAIKYSMLKVALPADLIFDMQKSVSFDGDSGPYLQYTYARCRSVLRRAHSQITNYELPFEAQGRRITLRGSGQANDEEKALLRLVYHFPEVVADAARHLTPNILCTYLFELAQVFNNFYAKHTILGTDDVLFRLQLAAATAQVLKNGLYLLGIEVLEQM